MFCKERGRRRRKRNTRKDVFFFNKEIILYSDLIIFNLNLYKELYLFGYSMLLLFNDYNNYYYILIIFNRAKFFIESEDIKTISEKFR